VDTVVVRVPATTANLGPGFDSLGIALAWHNEIRVDRSSNGLSVTATGPGAERVPRDTTNLVVRALDAVLGESVGVRIHEMISIPSGRGFGSSAAAVVAGLVAGRALGRTEQSDQDLLELAVEIEGHPDNVAPCLYGGLTVTAGGKTIRVDPPANIRPIVCVAPSRMATDLARAALPTEVSRADAVENLGRASLLLASLATGRADTLLEATEDFLHQARRFELMPDTGELVRALRGKGLAAFLSGAGPSAGILVDARSAEAAVSTARSLAPEAWEVRLEGFDASGAAIVSER
jgi:homoserine kinase